MEHVSKRFGDFYANRDINLSVRKGEVHTLLGENGAGKSTLMNVLIGLYQPTEGKIFLNGKEVRIDSPAQAVKLGIGMVHQHFMLVEAMTVFENIILGDRNTKGIFIDKEARKKEILELAERYGLDVELDRPITEIAVGAQQRVEILKTLYRGAELLILDEPTAALTDIEVEGLFQIIHKLTEEGKSVIFISHKMREVLQISDRITILRTGEVITTLDRSETDGQELANLMIGRELAPSHYGKVEEPGDPVIQMRSVDYHKESKHAGLSGVSLTVGRGEIVGIAGVDGNGQSQLAQVVTGVLTPDGGEVDMKGSKVAQFTPNGFILENVSHIPEDRNKMGLIGNMSVKDNIVLKATDSPEFSSAKGYFLKKKAIRDYALKMQEKYDIRCTSVEQETRNLSGGNQQKVILARELSLEEIRTIRDKTPADLEIEAFVHGAMCVSYSGRCLLSNYMTGRDSSRGACAQPCRYQYALVEEKRPGEYFPVFEDEQGTYILNSRDMCMIDHLGDLCGAGLSSLKIEGRAKSAYYAAIVTGAYRHCLDAAAAGESVDPVWRDEVEHVSHRPYSTGFYYGPPGQYYATSRYVREWQVAAVVTDCDSAGHAMLSLRNKFRAGDTVEIVGPDLRPFSITVPEMRDEAGASLVEPRTPQMKFYMDLPKAVPPYSLVRRGVDLSAK